MLSFLIAVCFSLDIADDFVRDARRAYALPAYASYTNSLIGTGRYVGSCYLDMDTSLADEISDKIARLCNCGM